MRDKLFEQFVFALTSRVCLRSESEVVQQLVRESVTCPIRGTPLSILFYSLQKRETVANARVSAL